jgi:hypothetical protein
MAKFVSAFIIGLALLAQAVTAQNTTPLTSKEAAGRTSRSPPVQGSDTQWYRNVLKNPSIRIDARVAEAGFQAVPVTDAKAVKSVVEKFRGKYGAKDVKKYYSKFNVAASVELV